VGVARNAGELRFRRDDEMITEVDARARFSDFLDLIEQCLERVRRHQVGNEGRDASDCRSSGFCCSVLRHARPCDVLAVSEVKVDIDHTGQNNPAADIECFGRIDSGSRQENGRDFSIVDRDVCGNAVGLRQNDGPATHHQVESHGPFPQAATLRAAPLD
jgi:hypothetical protein